MPARPFAEEGDELYEQGKYEQAILSYGKAIEIDPDYIKAWNSIGLALMALERFPEAEAAFARAGAT